MNPSKGVSPEKSAEEKRRIAKAGKWANDPLFDQVWGWRFDAALNAWESRQPKTEQRAAARRSQQKLDKEIAQVFRAAICQGNCPLLERLAKITEAVHRNFDWKAETFADLSRIISWQTVRPEKSMLAAIADHYFFHSGKGVDEAKKTRKTFMPYIAKKIGTEVDEVGGVLDYTGAFAKAFDRACKDLGISWKR